MALKVDYMVRETATNLVRNLSLTIASILTVAVSLSLVGGSVLLRYSVDNATQQWQGGIDFIVFMQPESTQDQTDAVERQLEDRRHLRLDHVLGAADHLEGERHVLVDRLGL